MRVVKDLSLMGVTVIILRKRMGLGLPMVEQLGGHQVGQLVCVCVCGGHGAGDDDGDAAPILLGGAAPHQQEATSVQQGRPLPNQQVNQPGSGHTFPL